MLFFLNMMKFCSLQQLLHPKDESLVFYEVSSAFRSLNYPSGLIFRAITVAVTKYCLP
ncbi:hypothetical protein DET47_109173 [Shewanella putrefaciens]|nr:hypothetical protein DET47_109173 [Shewanella putrefaciens]